MNFTTLRQNVAVKTYYSFIRCISSRLFGRKRYVVFESYPDYAGSPKMVCLEMEKRGFRSRYKFIWAIDKKQKHLFSDYDCVPFFGKMNFFDRLRMNVIKWNAVLIVDSNRPVYKTNERTLRIWTEHGGALKQCRAFMQSLGTVDYVLSLSSSLALIDFERFYPAVVTNMKQILILGHPANDEIFVNAQMDAFWTKTLNGKRISDYKKIVGWFPTFRQRFSNQGDDLDFIFPFGVPILKNKEELTLLNDCLRKEGVLLVVQIHHAQKKIYSIFEMSNIVVVNQEIKDECGVTNANLMHCFDALITDYSAAYHEFILLNRPIGISIDDFADYSKHVGFCFDFFDYIKGVYIKNIGDLLNFIREVSNNIDSASALRQISLKRIHKYADANSTNRVVDFISKRI